MNVGFSPGKYTHLIVAEVVGMKRIPSLGKEGWLRPLRKYREATLTGADGVVRSRDIALEF